MDLIATVLVLRCALPVGTGAQAAIDRKQIEREVMVVLALSTMPSIDRMHELKRQRTTSPTIVLQAAAWPCSTRPVQTQAWMNGTYKTFRESGWDHARLGPGVESSTCQNRRCMWIRNSRVIGRTARS